MEANASMSNDNQKKRLFIAIICTFVEFQVKNYLANRQYVCLESTEAVFAAAVIVRPLKSHFCGGFMGRGGGG